MVKIATNWKPSDSGTSVASNEGFNYLLESGDNILTENSFLYLLEPSVVSTKTPEIWSVPSKGSTAWKMTDGFTTFGETTEDTLVTQSGDTIVTQAGDTRIYQPSDANPKLPTIWTNN